MAWIVLALDAKLANIRTARVNPNLLQLDWMCLFEEYLKESIWCFGENVQLRKNWMDKWLITYERDVALWVENS